MPMDDKGAGSTSLGIILSSMYDQYALHRSSKSKEIKTRREKDRRSFS